MSRAAKAKLIASLITFESSLRSGQSANSEGTEQLHDPSSLQHNGFYNCLAIHGYDDLMSNQVGLSVSGRERRTLSEGNERNSDSCDYSHRFLSLPFSIPKIGIPIHTSQPREYKARNLDNGVEAYSSIASSSASSASADKSSPSTKPPSSDQWLPSFTRNVCKISSAKVQD